MSSFNISFFVCFGLFQNTGNQLCFIPAHWPSTCVPIAPHLLIPHWPSTPVPIIFHLLTPHLHPIPAHWPSTHVPITPHLPPTSTTSLHTDPADMCADYPSFTHSPPLHTEPVHICINYLAHWPHTPFLYTLTHSHLNKHCMYTSSVSVLCSRNVQAPSRRAKGETSKNSQATQNRS